MLLFCFAIATFSVLNNERHKILKILIAVLKIKWLKPFRYSTKGYPRDNQVMIKGALAIEALTDGYTLKSLRTKLSK